MKLGIVGSRSITDKSVVKQVLIDAPFISRDAGLWHLNTFVSGGADGVDTCAEEIAGETGVEIEVIEPNWDDWSKGHPAKVRNTKIVEQSDAVVAVWDGQSNGTRDTIDKTLDRGKPIYVEVFDE